ncbi:hypothetical protein [Candidatus Galacturonibacter soehngenii]|uniref:Uncharacterized protein n=1 Tax=Candidatus Galacturonatibacter soehngenii TaxID=2307010 RepID=A0A7V7QJ40_9FIRM|nr:hypothetical protein [Candidatus Galacturonibacter soehngenii]KAB1437579.1 hypothetical protein F7O84_08205 [Candidatus Galacturonibacter soehngenii]
MNDFKEMMKIATSTDSFLELPVRAQMLFCQLVLNADDEGYVLNGTAVRRMVRASEKDYNLLFDVGLINRVNGVIIITDGCLFDEEGGY